jgi:hypothetical protein
MESTQRRQVVDEIDRIPLKYLPGLLRMVRAFRETVTVETAGASFRQGWQESLEGGTRPASELWDADAGEGTSFWSPVSLDVLADQQGVLPADDLDSVSALWPADDDPDELLAHVLAERSARRGLSRESNG